MGRGEQELVAAPQGAVIFGDEYSVSLGAVPPDIGTEQHRMRLEAYAKQRCKRPNVSLRFEAFCSRCNHSPESHAGGGCGEGGCECGEYLPGGRSYTDMHGNVTVASDVPAGGSLGEREVCIEGLLRHELCHERMTDGKAYQAFLDDLDARRSAGDRRAAAQLKTLHNILEDGMIETRERAQNPQSYAFISAMNRLDPRIPLPDSQEPAQAEFWIPDPVDYVPTDANGVPLNPIENPRTGEPGYLVPAGTPITRWGATPLSLHGQARCAVHAMAIPEFELGELHPKVAAAMEEISEHVSKAIGGNTADCIVRSYKIHEILAAHGLLPASDEEQDSEETQRAQSGEGAATAPDADGGQNDGGGSQPMNGNPEGGTEMGDELKDQLGGGGESQQGEGAGESQQGEGAEGPQEMDDGWGDGESMSDPQQGRGQSAADGSQGDQRSTGSEGDGSDSGQGDGGGGYDPNAPIPKQAQDEMEAEGRGSVSDKELEDRIKDAERELEGDAERSRKSDRNRHAQGQFEGDDWSMPDGSAVTPQNELIASAVRQGGALKDEQGSLESLGRRLGDRLEQIKVKSMNDKRFLPTGRLDRRRYGSVIAGSRNAFKNPGRDLDLDMEIDVSIDRSSSVSSDNEQTANQYRMARMMAVAARETAVPMTIYGWSSGGWGYGGAGASVQHYAYKEKHSDQMEGIDALFQTGGGSTPTAEGVHFSRSRLAYSQAKQKVMVIVTDGGADDIPKTREEVRKAEDAGVQVLGLAFGCNADQMDAQFGSGNWRDIDDYTQAPQIIGDLIESAANEILARR